MFFSAHLTNTFVQILYKDTGTKQKGDHKSERRHKHDNVGGAKPLGPKQKGKG